MGAGCNTVAVTGAYTTTWGETVLADPTSGGSFPVTLPAASWGLDPVVVKHSGTANVVTVTRAGTALIDGATTVVLAPGQAVTLVPDGHNWQVTVPAARTVPTAPGIGVATAGVTQATVPFTAPASTGGFPITGYTATSSPGGITASASASPITVTGLTGGTAYTFTVHATNLLGNSPESAASNSVTPSSAPTAPGAPTIGTATGGNAQAVANWTAPGSNGGSAITGYTVTTYKASDNSVLFTDTVGVVLTFTRTGLTNGVGVYFKVAATNAIGTGSQSAASNTVTPVAPGATDNFNRADAGSLGTSSGGQTWTNGGAGHFAIASNKAVAVFTAGQLTVAWLETGLADFTLTCDIVGSATTEVGLVFRLVDSANHWLILANQGTFALYKVTAGGFTNLGGLPACPNGAGVTFTIKVVCSGSSIQTSIDSGSGFVAKHSVTDSYLSTATKVGLRTGVAITDTTSTYDNLSAS